MTYVSRLCSFKFFCLVILTLLVASFAPTQSRAESLSEPIAPGEEQPVLDRENVPESLQNWVEWVMYDFDEEKLNNPCPFLYSSYNDKSCQWPITLKLSVGENYARFDQDWQLYKKGWISLPGNIRHWPQNVTANGKTLPVLKRNGRPHIFLEAGQWTVSGQIDYRQMPETIKIPEKTGMVSLSIKGKTIASPEITQDGKLWINRTEKQVQTEADFLRLKVFRKIADNIPAQVETHIDLYVSGKHREIALKGALLDGFKPGYVNSPLPARLEKDGRLRLQVRPGRWTVRVNSYSTDPLSKLTPPARDEESKWPAQEHWAFEKRQHLRAVSISGVTPVDGSQVDMPSHWKNLPVYAVMPDQAMIVKQEERGIDETIRDEKTDKLHLKREWVMNIDGSGYSVRDHMTGTVKQSWRLNISDEMEPGRVSIDGNDQLITRMDENAPAGVEVRPGSLNLTADMRLKGDISTIPAVGWQHNVNKLSASLRLPPGWSLLYASGVDKMSGTWVGKWSLLDVFVVLVTAVALYKMFGVAYGLFGFVSLVLIYPEFESLAIFALIILTATVLLRAVQEGWLFRLATYVRKAAILMLIILVLPFMTGHLRNAVYPHLKNFSYSPSGHSYASVYRGSRAMPSPPSGLMMQDSISPVMEEEMMLGEQKNYSKRAYSTARKVEHKVKERLSMSGRGGNQHIMQMQNKEAYQLQNMMPKANVQTGFGVSNWRSRSLNMTWNGQVDFDQAVNLFFIPCWVNMILAFMRVFLLLGFVAMLILPPARITEYKDRLKEKLPSGAFLLALIFVASTICAPLGNTAAAAENANPFPPQHVLKELKHRIVPKPNPRPECLNACASLGRAKIMAEHNQLTIIAEVHADGGNVIVDLPKVRPLWRPTSVMVNNKKTEAFAYNKKPQIVVKPGVNRIVMIGIAPDADSFQVDFPLKAHYVDVNGKGWDISGIRPDGSTDSTLQFVRKQEKNQKAGNENKPEKLSPRILPPFLSVDRSIRLGLTWDVTTIVNRITDGSAGAVIKVPLLPSERVTSPGTVVKDGHVLVNFGAGSKQASWQSTISETTPLALSAPENVPWVETWRVTVGNIWHIERAGIPRIIEPGSQNSALIWRPWPGEKVSLDISRPDGIDGNIKTIDSAKITAVPGLRNSSIKLDVVMRSSQGAQHNIVLPESARKVEVKINNKTYPLRLKDDKRTLTIPVTPGKQNVEINWSLPHGIVSTFTMPKVDLGMPAVNITSHIKMPQARWILFAGGVYPGPAILFWSLVPIALIFAFGLGTIKTLPIKRIGWTLLLIGLIQSNMVASIVLILWFFAMDRRAKNTGVGGSPLAFNLRQLFLVALTFAAVIALFAGIKEGLMGNPDTHISGLSSSSRDLYWYQDISDNTPDQPWVFSLHKNVYNGIMLLWALWLAFSVIGWARWAWNAYIANGYWMKLPKRQSAELSDDT